MTNDSQDFSPEGLVQQRLGDLLQRLAKQGYTQQKVASRANIPPQYLSDIKRGQRPLTELVARRLAEEFNVDYEWLLGTSNTMESPRASGSSVSLPLLLHPVEGDPCENSQWNGSSRDVSGPATAKLDRIKQPYVLHLGHDDVRGRLRNGDLLLVSQIGSEHAEISVVKFRKKVLLARHNKNGTWERVATGTTMPETAAVVGHCVAIIWSSLE
jgi:transcriptional regulator with XRE-family HTH domain